jgi:hypothetical protein
MQQRSSLPARPHERSAEGGDGTTPALLHQSAAARLPLIRSAFACALHMHQPTIPAGMDGALISHLQWMFEHQGEGDNHNAAAFAHCYRRLADLLPQLINEGCEPRIMLDYSGNLLWGLEQMGRADILDALRFLACDPRMQPRVEWLGTFWSHAVAPSTPIPDLKLQILAWQHHFAALFGDAALLRIQGFSLPEMALPNHPDSLHALVKALRQCGYRWLLVQEHSVETLQGESLSHAQRYQPNRLVARSSSGEVATITALIKTQGSDTKLVGQMQPYYEALSLEGQELAGVKVPPLVSQIADGENGGVMMNEFPQAFLQAHRRVAEANRAGGEHTIALNGSEYLDLLAAAGVCEEAFPAIQAVGQHRLWQHLGDTAPGSHHGTTGPQGSDRNTDPAEEPRSAPTSPAAAATPFDAPAHSGASAEEALATAIAALRQSSPGFSMEGASWTNDLSWVEGYANVLEPMNELSARFHQRWDPQLANDPAITRSHAYQESLLHLLLLETSCFRYWGQGTWTDYARELHLRGLAATACPPQAAAAAGKGQGESGPFA